MDVNEALRLFDQLCNEESEIPLPDHLSQNVSIDATVEPTIRLPEDDLVVRPDDSLSEFIDVADICSEITVDCDSREDECMLTDHSYSFGNLSSTSNDHDLFSESVDLGHSDEGSQIVTTESDSIPVPQSNSILNINISNIVQTHVNSAESEVTVDNKLESDTVIVNESPPVSDDATRISVPGVSSELKSRSRKRTRGAENWQRNVRKRLCQSGESYVNSKGKQQCARSVKTRKDCRVKCKFKCALLISDDMRQHIHSSFWMLSDDEKQGFYGSTTTRTVKERSRVPDTNSERKKYSVAYFFKIDDSLIRVCKEFYLSTIDICQKRVSYFYEKETLRFSDSRGKHVKTKTSEEKIQCVKAHIQSFPRIPSHYCRASTKREYLEAGLSMSKMYELYTAWCLDKVYAPVTLYMYRTIFLTSFNIGFHVPKKDRCHQCEEYNVLKKRHTQVSDEAFAKYLAHINDKENSRAERAKDRKSNNVVVCFDMENVITLPKTNISSAFYKRKLTVFNLTANCSKNKINYNAIWAENIGGRDGNAISSALVVILDKMCEDLPDTESIILWSDSCVPQNRNSHMAMALKLFMRSHPNIVKIEQKFSTPGHSCVQEVDNAHSHNERALSVSEVFSPLGLIRVLKSVRPNSTKFIQMRPENFLNFQKASTSLRFSRIPFATAKQLVYEKDNIGICSYRTSFAESHLHEKSLTFKTRNTNVASAVGAPVLRNKAALPREKIKDLKSMIKFMPQPDNEFYETIFQMNKKNKN